MTQQTRAELQSEVERLTSEIERLQGELVTVGEEGITSQTELEGIRTRIQAHDGETTTDRLESLLTEGDDALEEIGIIRERLGVVEEAKASDVIKQLMPSPPPEDDLPEFQMVRYTGGGALGFNHGGSYHSISANPVSVPTATAEFALATYPGQIVPAQEV